MAYRVAHAGSFRRDAKNFYKQAQLKELIKKSIAEVIQDPTCGELMKHNFKGYSNYHFNRSSELRLIYVVYPYCGQFNNPTLCIHEENLSEDERDSSELAKKCKGLIEFVFVKTREECNSLYKLHKN